MEPIRQTPLLFARESPLSYRILKKHLPFFDAQNLRRNPRILKMSLLTFRVTEFVLEIRAAGGESRT